MLDVGEREIMTATQLIVVTILAIAGLLSIILAPRPKSEIGQQLLLIMGLIMLIGAGFAARVQ
jgi:uncharacterized membrane protein